MIPAQIGTDLATLQGSVSAATPIKQATPLLKAALLLAGNALVKEIDDAFSLTLGALDSGDPAVAAGDLASALNDLAIASDDQATLADLRGTVGRAVFNLAQV